MNNSIRYLAVFIVLTLTGFLAGPPYCRAEGDDLARTAVRDTPAWSQFRGPDRSAVSSEVGLRRSWADAGPTELWRRPLGEGFSGIVVADGRLFTLFADGDGEFAGSFHVKDGSAVWKRRIGDKFVGEWGNGPQATPTLDGDTLYVLGTRGELWALSANRGDVKWRLDFNEEFGTAKVMFELKDQLPPESGRSGTFAHSSSPIVFDDLLIVYTSAGDGKSMVGLDKHSGEVRWTALAHPTSNSSPISVSIGGRRQVVMVLSNEIVSLTASGDVLWRFPWTPVVTVSQPVFVSPDMIFVSTIYDVGAAAVRISGGDGGFQPEPAWRQPYMRNSWSSSVYDDGYIYGFDKSTIRCLSAASGEQMWAKRGYGVGTLLIADGLLFMLSERGLLVLAEATPERFQEAGKVQALTGRCWTVPSLFDGKLFLRNHEEVLCLDLKH